MSISQHELNKRRLLEETEGFKNGVPNSVGILILNSFGARHAQWSPPTG